MKGQLTSRAFRFIAALGVATRFQSLGRFRCRQCRRYVVVASASAGEVEIDKPFILYFSH